MEKTLAYYHVFRRTKHATSDHFAHRNTANMTGPPISNYGCYGGSRFLAPSILGTAINLLPVLLGRGNLTGKMRMLSLSPSMFSPIYSPGGPRLPGIHGKLD